MKKIYRISYYIDGNHSCRFFTSKKSAIRFSKLLSDIADNDTVHIYPMFIDEDDEFITNFSCSCVVRKGTLYNYHEL